MAPPLALFQKVIRFGSRTLPLDEAKFSIICDYHSIFKNENFVTRFVHNKHPLLKCQPLDHSDFIPKKTKDIYWELHIDHL